MDRRWSSGLGLVAALAAACAGGSPAPSTTATLHGQPGTEAGPAYAVFHVHGMYLRDPALPTGPLVRRRFTISCTAPWVHEEAELVSWNVRLCAALIDYAQAPKRNVACGCPAEPRGVAVRGIIGGRPVLDAIGMCDCGATPRTRRDASTILSLAPPVRRDG